MPRILVSASFPAESLVWTAQSGLRHLQVIYGHEGQPWHYAMRDSHVHGAPLGYDQLCQLAPPLGFEHVLLPHA